MNTHFLKEISVILIIITNFEFTAMVGELTKTLTLVSIEPWWGTAPVELTVSLRH